MPNLPQGAYFTIDVAANDIWHGNVATEMSYLHPRHGYTTMGEGTQEREAKTMATKSPVTQRIEIKSKNGWVLQTELSSPIPEAERKEISKIYMFRKEAAKLFKFNNGPAELIRRIRNTYRLNEPVTPLPVYEIYNAKYNISKSYCPSEPETRKRALTAYKEQIKARRQEIREVVDETSQTGFLQNQKIHKTPNGVLNWYCLKLLQTAKRPQTNDRHIGIEIEHGIPLVAGYTDFLPFKDKISFIGDGSISDLPKGYKSTELRLLTTEKEYKTDIAEVCRLLEKNKAVVNSTCGLHVHIDMRQFSQKEINRQFANLVRSQKYLQGLVDTRRRANRYCKPTRYVTPENCVDRYLAINPLALSKYNTIEIRLHHGTLDAQEIINWISILLRITASPAIKKPVATLDKFIKKIDLADELAKYMKDKTAKNEPVVDPVVEPLLARCTRAHLDGILCARCGCDRLGHSGHNCRDGQIGLWPCNNPLSPRLAQVTTDDEPEDTIEEEETENV